jgi:hypothetical protein
MFRVDEDALKYIKHKSGAIMIDMKMKPSIEG